MFPELASVQHDKLPFEHFVGRAMQTTDRQAWLDWLEQDAPWQLVTTDFYEQYEFSLLHTPLTPTLSPLTCRKTLKSLRNQMAAYFCHPLSERVEVTVHKLLPHQTIRIHNDFIPDSESHRLLLQLNRDWRPEHGGYLMFFAGAEPETVTKIVEPIHGSVQAFAISPQSYHAVSTVHQGERFTVVYSFYPDACRR